MSAIAHIEGRLDRHALIRGHVEMARRLARKVARRVPRSILRDELESAALLGLTEAAVRYDPHRGEPFVAYAAKRVRGAILDELRRSDPMTRRGREGARKLADAARAVEAKVGRPATTDEIAGMLGATVDEVSRARARFQSPAMIGLDEAHDLAQPTDDDSPHEKVSHEQQLRTLAGALAKLPQRDLQILSLYYQENLTLKEIGDVLGVTESRVSQLRTRAIAKLRKVIDVHG
jgi:RNA polymerase sigma factor for flagellar operon FliA